MLLADRGYDADWIRALVGQQGAWANIPPKRNRKDVICFSPYLYRARNLIERFFNKIKQCRRIATRYDRLAANYLALSNLRPSVFGCVFMSPRRRTITAPVPPSLRRIVSPARFRSDLEVSTLCMMETASARPCELCVCTRCHVPNNSEPDDCSTLPSLLVSGSAPLTVNVAAIGHTPQIGKFDYIVTSNQSGRSSAS
jgi:transposase